MIHPLRSHSPIQSASRLPAVERAGERVHAWGRRQAVGRGIEIGRPRRGPKQAPTEVMGQGDG